MNKLYGIKEIKITKIYNGIININTHFLEFHNTFPFFPSPSNSYLYPILFIHSSSTPHPHLIHTSSSLHPHTALRRRWSRRIRQHARTTTNSNSTPATSSKSPMKTRVVGIMAFAMGSMGCFRGISAKSSSSTSANARLPLHTRSKKTMSWISKLAISSKSSHRMPVDGGKVKSEAQQDGSHRTLSSP